MQYLRVPRSVQCSRKVHSRDWSTHNQALVHPTRLLIDSTYSGTPTFWCTCTGLRRWHREEKEQADWVFTFFPQWTVEANLSVDRVDGAMSTWDKQPPPLPFTHPRRMWLLCAHCGRPSLSSSVWLPPGSSSIVRCAGRCIGFPYYCL